MLQNSILSRVFWEPNKLQRCIEAPKSVIIWFVGFVAGRGIIFGFGGKMGKGGGLMKQAMLFNKSLLQYLACPLSKEPLRYCEKSQELVSDTVGVAYPIIDGIPCLIPVRGRILDEPSSAK